MLLSGKTEIVPLNCRLLRAFASRCTGPGGYYNLGNALGLLAGLMFQALSHYRTVDSSVIAIAGDYLVGSPGATALSMATGMFFVSGEMYHRAWAERSTPDYLMLRRADFLSGVAALILAVTLALFGSFWLALGSTVLLAGGKFGNALTPEGWPVRIEFVSSGATTRCRQLDLFRVAALLSRIPAIAAIFVELARLLAVGTSDVVLDLGQPLVLLTCYLLWARADLLLFRN